jgi:thiamine monophosphate synthase
LRVCALVADLMDRSRISASVPDVVFGRDVAACADADVVIVDLARSGHQVGALRAALPDARIVGFGPHVDEESAAAARAAGADLVLPRSKFFRDPSASLRP